MTTERLEELARWAESRAAEAERRMDAAGASGEWITGGTEVHREELRYFADLARCARAWAKVERHKDETPCVSWWTQADRHGFILDTSWKEGLPATAIEAVEAAELGR